MEVEEEGEEDPGDDEENKDEEGEILKEEETRIAFAFLKEQGQANIQL